MLRFAIMAKRGERSGDFGNWLNVFRSLNEAQSRWFAAQKALELGRGGIKQVHELTGLSRTTLIKGMDELKRRDELDTAEGIRRRGGGRKKAEVTPEYSPLVRELEKLLDENTAGNPMSLLKWTLKSTRTLAKELTGCGYSVSAMTVCRLLHKLDYSLQANRKTIEKGADHPNRDQQFRHINKTVKKFLAKGDPVISVDTKKKERIGKFKNSGRTWQKKGQPKEVNIYDFPSLAKGTAVPYGTYDVQRNEGMVNVGMSRDTAEFAVESIRQWWRRFGRRHYPEAKRLLICADGGGSNGSRSRAWKYHLQQLADEMAVTISVCHYPPGTSKWNKIEHRMFSFISMNWKGQPLVSFETVVKLIEDTRNRKGLKVKARLDTSIYEKGLKIPDETMEQVRIEHDRVCPQWNYAIKARKKRLPKKRKRKKDPK